MAGGKLPEGVWEDILAAVKEVEAAYGAKFADPADPLLFSVRSGAAVSMPVSAGLGMEGRSVCGVGGAGVGGGGWADRVLWCLPWPLP